MDPSLDIVTLGEALIRYSPNMGERLETSSELHTWIGGAEVNVATNCASVGLNTAWLGKLPENPLGRQVCRHLRQYGIRTSGVVSDPSYRMGIYYVELGQAPRSTQVMYDRERSAASTMMPGDVDQDLLARAKVFHTTGITPALSDGCRETTISALQQARSAGVRTAFDLNYRAKLWSPNEARPTLERCLEHVDIAIVAESEVQQIWAIDGEDTILDWLSETFNPAHAVVTLGDQGALAQHDGQTYRVQAFPGETVDPIGTGDAFTAGYLYGLLREADVETALEYAALLAAFKRTLLGDSVCITENELEDLWKNQNVEIRR
ncbi:MAG: PfkB family carbohydrate kinase [Salinibacter sp.]